MEPGLVVGVVVRLQASLAPQPGNHWRDATHIHGTVPACLQVSGTGGWGIGGGGGRGVGGTLDQGPSQLSIGDAMGHQLVVSTVCDVEAPAPQTAATTGEMQRTWTSLFLHACK